jgi:hypothetical protein
LRIRSPSHFNFVEKPEIFSVVAVLISPPGLSNLKRQILNSHEVIELDEFQNIAPTDKRVSTVTILTAIGVREGISAPNSNNSFIGPVAELRRTTAFVDMVKLVKAAIRYFGGVKTSAGFANLQPSEYFRLITSVCTNSANS